MTKDAKQPGRPRWYVVSPDGLAVPCHSEDYAKSEAELRNKIFPCGGPRRAVQLVDVSLLAGLVSALDRLRAALDPDDWCSDERMIDVINAAISAVAAINDTQDGDAP